MRRRMLVLFLLLLAFSWIRAAGPPALADDAKALSPAEVARIGRPATALVVVKGFANGEGSAFCVRSDGMFVTNHHVIQHAKQGFIESTTMKWVAEGKISLVLNSGRDDQRVVTARVLRSDPSWDLALLQAEGVEGFPALPITPEEGLAEARVVVALGFPLGSALAVQGGTYPSVNVNKGTIRAIKKDGDVPSDIEADLSINPGNSGGPLLDNRGRVAGVIYARVEPPGKPGYSLAVPTNRLESFLSRPVIAFEPPQVTRDGRDKPVEFKATLTSDFAPREQPTMELVLSAGGKSTRHYPMTRSNETYRVEAPPFAGEAGPRRVKLTVSGTGSKEPLAVAWVEDRKLSGEINAGRSKEVEDFQLASVKSLHLFASNVLAFFEDAGKSSSKNYSRVAGMDAVLAAIKDQQPSFSLPRDALLTVNQVADNETVICSVIARRSGRTVAEIFVPMKADDGQPATLKAVSEGQFLRPRPGPSPVNSLRVFIPEDDPAGQAEITLARRPVVGNNRVVQQAGGTAPTRKVIKQDDRKNDVVPGPGDPDRPGRVCQYDDAKSRVSTQFNRHPQMGPDYGKRGWLKISGIGPLETSILLLLADFERLKVGEYAIEAPGNFDRAGPFPPEPHLQLTRFPAFIADANYSGRFRVWEFEMDPDSTNMRLAVDFVLYRKTYRIGENPRPSIAGMVRVNSKYQ